MGDSAQIYNLETTPKDQITRTGDNLPDDHNAFVEWGERAAPKVEPEAATIPDWRLANSLTKLRNQINAAHPGRDKSKDGTIGDSNHCPDPNHTGSSDHCLNIKDGGKGIVAALDVTHDPDKCDVDVIVEAIRGEKDSRIKYIIWNKRICNSKAIGGAPAWDWRTYGGSDPHTGHAHFSMKSSKSEYDDTSDWKIS